MNVVITPQARLYKVGLSYGNWLYTLARKVWWGIVNLSIRNGWTAAERQTTGPLLVVLGTIVDVTGLEPVPVWVGIRGGVPTTPTIISKTAQKGLKLYLL